MLLSSVILVLREILEAALLFSLLMVLSRRSAISFRWVWIALAIGLLGASIYGFNIDLISDAFDGVGQEVTNASLQLLIYILLCVLTVLTVRQYRGTPAAAGRLTILMTAAVLLAVVREGSEIMIYLSSFIQVPGQLNAVLAGSAIGAGIGISVGAVFYFALLNIREATAALTCAILLVFVGGGMASQAAMLLIQADWLPAQYPLWDSSWLISEQSVTGQLLYAMFGYEATPTPLQLTIYVVSLAIPVVAALLLTQDRRTIANAAS